MTKLTSRHFIIALSATAFLAGCQARNNAPVVAIAPTAKPDASSAAKPKLAALEGKWVPKDQAARAVYYNEFRKGKFGAYSADGKSTLAVGTYNPNANGASVKYFSQANGREIKANCVTADNKNMTCTTDSGNVAELVRV